MTKAEKAAIDLCDESSEWLCLCGCDESSEWLCLCGHPVSKHRAYMVWSDVRACFALLGKDKKPAAPYCWNTDLVNQNFCSCNELQLARKEEA